LRERAYYSHDGYLGEENWRMNIEVLLKEGKQGLVVPCEVGKEVE